MPGLGRLQDRVAIVTGSSSGLGRAIALAYATEGGKVVCSDLKPESSAEPSLQPTHEAIEKDGGEAVFVKTDVGEPDSVKSLVEQAVKKFGRLDIMVNNAGIAPETQPGTPKKTHETDPDTFDRTLRINTKGVFLGCKYGIAQMLEQEPLEGKSRGWVINTASVAGWIGIAYTSSYTASKHACIGITKVAALEYAPQQIHVNALCPGYIETPMTKNLRENAATHDAALAKHPWGRYGKPEDIARVAVFLASDDASFITGVPLPIDGGYLAQ